jgi:hypothetical protein
MSNHIGQTPVPTSIDVWKAGSDLCFSLVGQAKQQWGDRFLGASCGDRIGARFGGAHRFFPEIDMTVYGMPLGD